MTRYLRPELALIVALVACSPAVPAAPTVPTAGTVSQLADVQKFTMAYPVSIPSLDPHLVTSGTVRKHEMFETLTIQDVTGQKVEPLLATEWRLTDSTTWRFMLRKDSKFQDNTPLTADDVIFSWGRVTNPALKSPVPGNLSTVADFVKADAYTVDVKTKQPDPMLPKRTSMLAILPKAYIERVGDQEFAAKPIGSGPFKLVEFKPDDRTVLTRWSEHPWRKPTLTDVTIRTIPDAVARLNGLRSGDLDFASLMSFEQVDVLQREGFATDIAGTGVSGAFLDTWGTDGTDAGPVGNKLVRQAINYAIDRESLSKTIYKGIAKPAGLTVFEGSFGYDPSIKQYVFDLAKAKALMAQAGYPNGFKTTMAYYKTTQESETNAIFVQSQLKEIGIEAEFELMDFATFLEKVYKRRPSAPIFLGALNTDPLMDAESALNWFWSDNKGFGKRYSVAEFDRLFVQAQQEMDSAKREKLLQQALGVLQENPAWVGLVNQPRVTAKNKKVQGAVTRTDMWPSFDQISITKS